MALVVINKSLSIVWPLALPCPAVRAPLIASFCHQRAPPSVSVKGEKAFEVTLVATAA